MQAYIYVFVISRLFGVVKSLAVVKLFTQFEGFRVRELNPGQFYLPKLSSERKTHRSKDIL